MIKVLLKFGVVTWNLRRINELQIFKNEEFGKIEILIKNGKEYFPATEIAKILGYTNPQKAIRDHCKEKGCLIRSVLTNGGKQGIRAETIFGLGEERGRLIFQPSEYRNVQYKRESKRKIAFW